MCGTKEMYKTDEGLVAFLDEKSGIEIVNPFVSTCGRFDVEPEDAYDLDADLAVEQVLANVRIANGRDFG